MDDLVERNDLYYKKFSDVPFTGEVSGMESGKFKNGKKNGEFVRFYENGQLSSTGNYKDGEQDGLYQFFNKDGSLQLTETWKDGDLVDQVYH